MSTERAIMETAVDEFNDGNGPVVIRFEAELVREAKAGESKAGKKDDRILLVIPAAVGEKLGGMSKVEGTINGHPFRATLERTAAGALALPVNAAMQKGAGAGLGAGAQGGAGAQKGAGAGVGDTVQLAILGPEPEPVMPADLEAAMAASPAATALWHDLTDLGQRDYLRWIALAKKPETRARRITRTVEQLAEGKRRACCVNVNEYMLCRIEEAGFGA